MDSATLVGVADMGATVVAALALGATAVGLRQAGGQLSAARQQLRVADEQAKTQFEDALVRDYRAIVHQLPVEALLGARLTRRQARNALGTFYRYVELTNHQIVLRQQGRIRRETWSDWIQGIDGNLRLPAFRNAWEVIKERATGDFAALRRLEAGRFAEDPRSWTSHRDNQREA